MADRTVAHAATVVVVVQAGAVLIGTMCPPVYDVRAPQFHAAGDRDRNVLALRQGYRAAAALTLATGAVAATLVRSVLPLAVAGVIAAADMAVYEYGIRHPAGDG